MTLVQRNPRKKYNNLEGEHDAFDPYIYILMTGPGRTIWSFYSIINSNFGKFIPIYDSEDKTFDFIYSLEDLNFQAETVTL